MLDISEGLDPHSYFEKYVLDKFGRKASALNLRAADSNGAGAEDDKVLRAIFGVIDQLSLYDDIIPNTHISMREVRLKDGAERAYVLVRLKDGEGPLRLRDATDGWDGGDDTGTTTDWVGRHVSRRWRFIRRYMNTLIDPMVEGVIQSIDEYYKRKPGAVPVLALTRFLEEPDCTYWCMEIDDTSITTPKDLRNRYKVQ